MSNASQEQPALSTAPGDAKRERLTRPAAADWREAAFEVWFRERPELPNGEPLLIISTQRPLKRMVDVVALDRDGGIVIIEVKNERSTRTAVGQALEYLSQYQHVTVEELEDEFSGRDDGSLSETFRRRFKRDLQEIAPRRRVFIAAPEFDYHSDICMQFLSRALAGQQAEFGLIVVNHSLGSASSFAVSAHNSIELTPAKDLRGFVMSPRGRIYYVLEAGARPVMWLIGKRDEEGRLCRPKKPALRIRTKPHILLKVPPPEVEIPNGNSTWQKNADPTKQARLLGTAVYGSRRCAVLARFRNGEFVKLQFRDYGDLEVEWKKTGVDGLPGWRDLARLMQ